MAFATISLKATFTCTEAAQQQRRSLWYLWRRLEPADAALVRSGRQVRQRHHRQDVQSGPDHRRRGRCHRPPQRLFRV